VVDLTKIKGAMTRSSHGLAVQMSPRVVGLTKIAAGVHRFAVDSESEHGNGDLAGGHKIDCEVWCARRAKCHGLCARNLAFDHEVQI
jgi:hypothetical protein